MWLFIGFIILIWVVCGVGSSIIETIDDSKEVTK